MTRRRWAVWGVALAGGVVTITLAAVSLATSRPSVHLLPSALVLLALSAAAERWPMQVGPEETISLAAIFVVCAAVMDGAAVAALVATAVCALQQLRDRQHLLKFVFNLNAYALMGGTAGLAAHVHPRGGGGLLLAVLLAALAQYVTNVVLVVLVVTHARLRELVSSTWSMTKVIVVPFAFSLSIAPLFIVTWDRYPYVAIMAVVPLGVIALHMRAMEQSRKATALALTDPLTGLGNRRHFSERLQQELDRAEEKRRPLSVCVLDLDRLKAINDGHGHERGDLALTSVAGALRHGGEAFRVGGDEFVVLLPAHDREAATAVAAAIRDRVRSLEQPDGVRLDVSAGTATYYGDGRGRGELLREADAALYEQKLAYG
jgi:diguanylate cyclase (GGDEF)-like protein